MKPNAPCRPTNAGRGWRQEDHDPGKCYLFKLAQRSVQPYLALPQVRAALITGSVALGVSDHYSDIDLIAAWKARIAAYPPALAQAMVEQHLQFFPLRSVQEQLATRDAVLWRYQILTEAAYNLLAILAGLNRLYVTTFQFKRLRHFTAHMAIQPADCAARLDRLFSPPAPAAALELEALVGETIDLVTQHLPQIDVSGTQQRLGRRRPAWQFA